MSVAYTWPKSKTERRRKTKIGTEVAHVTNDSDTTFKVKRSKVKGQGHQAALLTAVLARQAASAVGVGTCWPWDTAATLPSARRRKAPTGVREGRGYIVAAARLQLVKMMTNLTTVNTQYNTILKTMLWKFFGASVTNLNEPASTIAWVRS